jgi:hypothetical protein
LTIIYISQIYPYDKLTGILMGIFTIEFVFLLHMFLFKYCAYSNTVHRAGTISLAMAQVYIKEGKMLLIIQTE